MAKGLSLKALLSLDSKQFRKGINDVKKQLNGFKSFIKGAFALGSITAFGKQMVTVSKDFEDAMAKVQAVSNATADEFKKMNDEAKRLGETTRYTASEAASALENLTRNGLNASQATKALSSVLQLAQANAIELSTAADILTNTMNAFGLSVKDTSRINDVLSSTAANAATNISELYEALIVAGPYAKIMGKSIEETSAALGVLANKGIKGSGAGKALAAMYQRLASITPKAAKAMAEYGLEITEAELKTSDFLTIIKKLNASGIGKSVGALSEVFGKNFAGDIAQIINSVDEFDGLLNTVANSAGTTARMFEQGVGSVQKELDTLKSNYEGLLITIGNKTGGVVKGAIRLLQNLVNNFKTVGGSIMNIASVAVPLLSSKLIKLGKEFKTLFTLMKTEGAAATAMMGGWITAVATLVTWVGTALVGAWNRAHQAMRDANKQLKEAESQSIKTKNAVDNLKRTIGDGSNTNSINSAVNKAIELFPEFTDVIKNAADEARKTGGWEKLKSVLEDISRLQNAIVSKDAKEALYDAQVQSFGAKVYSNRRNEPTLKNINKQLESTGLSKDAIKLIITEIANNAATEGTYNSASAIDSIRKILEDYNVKDISDYQLTKMVSWINGRATRQEHGYTVEYGLGGAKDVYKASSQLYKADSTVVSETYKIYKENFDAIKKSTDEQLSNQEINQQQHNDKMYKAAQDFYDKVSSLDGLSRENQKEAEQIVTAYTPPKTITPPSLETDDVKPKTKSTKDLIKGEIENYQKELAQLNNRKAADTISNYDEEVDKLEDSTWEAITALDNFKAILEELGQTALGDDLASKYKENREKGNQKEDKKISLEKPSKPVRDTQFDYMLSNNEVSGLTVKVNIDYAEELQKYRDDLKEASESGQLDMVKEDVAKKVKELDDEINNLIADSNQMQHTMNFAQIKEEIDGLNKELRNAKWESFTSIASGIKNIQESIESIRDTFNNVDATAFEKIFSIINAIIQAVETVSSIIQAINVITDITSAIESKKTAEKGAQLALSTGIAAAETEAAVAGGVRLATEEFISQAMASQAAAATVANSMGVPYPANIAALASNVAAAASSFATIKGLAAFAEGGVVDSKYTTGDRNIIRVNGGEMILNKGQQATLFNAIKNGNLGGGGTVEFKIRGGDLVGTLNNYNKLRK